MKWWYLAPVRGYRRHHREKKTNTINYEIVCGLARRVPAYDKEKHRL